MHMMTQYQKKGIKWSGDNNVHIYTPRRQHREFFPAVWPAELTPTHPIVTVLCDTKLAVLAIYIHILLLTMHLHVLLWAEPVSIQCTLHVYIHVCLYMYVFVFSEQSVVMDTLSLIWGTIYVRCVLGIIESPILKELHVSVKKTLLEPTAMVSEGVGHLLEIFISDMCSSCGVLGLIYRPLCQQPFEAKRSLFMDVYIHVYICARKQRILNLAEPF